MSGAAKQAPKDIPGLARLIQSDDVKSIAILTGAGVSVASGIPDFRSPGGMYDTLKPEKLTATEAQRRAMTINPMEVVNWRLFQENALPWLEVRRPFILGTQQRQWKATLAHRFFELLHTKTGKLTRVYTQNIDGLDHQCQGIPNDKIVMVHGTMSRAACEGCGHQADFDQFCSLVESNIKNIYNPTDGPKESTPIPCSQCNQALVKPKTVLFGRRLPDEFFDCFEKDIPSVDLLIVAGSSLVVSPANSLVYSVPKKAIRVVINNEKVGEDLGIEYSEDAKQDFFAQGQCDEVFLELMVELGWLDDLKAKLELLPTESARLARLAVEKRES